MKKTLKVFSLVVLILIIVGFVWAYQNVRDRHPDYSLDLNLKSEQPGEFKAGFAAFPITPKIEDVWTDANNDAKFDPDDGDTFQDLNGNGEFDAYWIAGFDNARAANGVHDDLWARVVVVDNGQARIAIVSLDVVGFGHDDVVDVRKRIPASAGVDYTLISATHVHEAVDLVGIWGESQFESGVNPEYMDFVQQQIADAVTHAAKNLRPAKLRFAQDLTGADPYVTDSRPPFIKDPGLRLMHAVDAESDTTLGVLVAWANHPETLWSKNLLLSSDFPHYIREGLEKGVYNGETLHMAGLGGTAVYINGAIGGLMTTDPDLGIKDPFSDQEFFEPSFEKIKAQGDQIAMLALNALRGEGVVEIENGRINLLAKTLDLPLENKNFRLASLLGVLDRGMAGWFKMRTEIAAFEIGPASFLSVPGEIYPEIINGGIEAPEGQDFETEPVETPPLRSLMQGEFKFVIGLGNDLLGYIIPRSEWDEEAPFIYDLPNSPYGEINSVGPDTAPLLHAAMKELLLELSEKP